MFPNCFKVVCEFEDEISTQIFHDVLPNHELDQCTDGPGCTKIGNVQFIFTS